jgi:Tfp pilus assembly PilM family ATPase
MAGTRRPWRLTTIGTPGPLEPMTLEGAAQLRQELKRTGFVGRDVIVAPPEALLMSSIMELPSASVGVPTAQLARMEMGRLHNCEPGSFEMACWTLPRPARAANTDLVMATACRCDLADALLDALEGAGLRVRALRSRSAGLIRACRDLLDPIVGMAGLLDVTMEQARLSLLYAGAVVYERTIPNAEGEVMVKALAQTAGQEANEVRAALLEGRWNESPSHGKGHKGSDTQDPVRLYTQALIEGARLPLTYASNQYPDTPIEAMFVTGLAAAAPAICQMLAGACPCPVRPVLPADLTTESAPDRPDGYELPQLTAAIGLGARE